MITNKSRPTAVNLLFAGFFSLALASAVLWLSLGALPALVDLFPALHPALHGFRRGPDWFAQLLNNASRVSHSVGGRTQTLFDFLFSGLNVTLALLLIRLRPRDRSARLLALGMLGTAVAFNLQAHDALQVVPVTTLSQVNVWHTFVHLVSGLCYMFALLLFPYGTFPAGRGLGAAVRGVVLALVTVTVTILSLLSSDDHTYGLVLVFGLAVPVVGAVAQVGRLRSRTIGEKQRGESRLLLLALGAAFLVAVPLVMVSSSQQAQPDRTLSYEVQMPAAGIYFFRCDPHPEDMTGVLQVVGPEVAVPDEVTLVAKENLFDRSGIVLPAGVLTDITLTNQDTELHNVAIYRDASAQEPLFIGAEFSGSAESRFAFRVFRALFTLIPLALVIGLVRYRLWDVERFINRTLAYGLVAAAITAAYLVIVVGVGAALGSGGRFNVVISSAATAIIAIAFQPLRQRAYGVANRLVYGRKSSPYEVLRNFSDRVGDSFAVEEVLPEMAQALGEGTSATHTEIWLRVGDELVRSAAWPGACLPATRPVGHGLDDGMIAVVHDGDLLGAITLTWPPGGKPTPVESELVAGVAAQAGLALSNAQLTAQLKARVEELRASRERIVSAQDRERRRIERDIHDGAQPSLLAAGMRVGLAESLLDTDPKAVREVLKQAQESMDDAIGALRDLARGIYPPILAAKGLEVALDAYARRCPVDLETRYESVGRYRVQLESAVYFCCLEAIQNAVKHGSWPVTLVLTEAMGELTFTVTDPGPGFDVAAPAADPKQAQQGAGLQNMADRMAALGGMVTVNSTPGGPTQVKGSVSTR